MPNCIVAQTSQPAVSAIPGNIGQVRAKVVVWDHDPFLARPHQHLMFPFSKKSAEQLDESPVGLEFALGTAFLKPIFTTHNMFVATKIRQEESESEALVPGLDFVGGPNTSSGKEGEPYLPGGFKYILGTTAELVRRAGGVFGVGIDTGSLRLVGAHIFPHQLWIYTGSLLKDGVIVHPSEYNKDTTETKAYSLLVEAPQPGYRPSREDHFQKYTLAEIQSGPRWDYRKVDDDGSSAIWPYMTNKHNATNPVHWTLEKFTPLWQGEDFSVRIKIGDKITDDAVDDAPESDIVDTNHENYIYLMYYPERLPTNDPKWTDGISNEAYFIKPQEGVPFVEEEDISTNKSLELSRKLYWWRYKTYILIEVGVHDTVHNYFIEIVKGRNPRLIHLGYEWDNPKRIQEGAVLDSNDFDWMKKAREISVYEHVSSDTLFKRKEFKVTVRNHLGRLVITFDGYEGLPWIISRLDNDPEKFNFDKKLMPMVIPSGKMRIHGGNISCAFNFSPTQYVPKSSVVFKNRQADTGPPWKRATNKDLYMTFSTRGNSILYNNPSVRRRFFNDDRLGQGIVGYNCDAYSVYDYIKNSQREIKIYELYNKQYRLYGKGWLSTTPLADDGTAEINPDTKLFEPHVFTTAVKTPHQLRIVNARNEGKSFTFGLDEESDASYPYKEDVSKWDVGVEFVAGSINFPKSTDGEIEIPGAMNWHFENCLTPIATQWSMIVLGAGKPIKDNIDEPLDISSLITSINDGWSADGFTTINHEAQLRAYIPIGAPSGGEPNPNELTEQIALYEKGQALLKLHKQAFYVTVSYWWDNGVGERDAIGNLISRSGPPGQDDLLIQLTGVAYGGELEKSINKLFMNFTIKDYMSIMQKQFIFNSPFFDGVSDIMAVHELGKMAGFDSTVKQNYRINRQPLGYLDAALKKRYDDCRQIVYNGEKSIARSYDLPMSYADLVKPGVRFQNGETFESALKKIAQFASKIVYFDRWGVLRLENIPAIEAAFQSGPSPQTFKPVFQFTTSPFPVSDAGGGGGTTASDRFEFNPNDPTRGASHLVYNVVTYSRSVEDCVNQIVLLSASNSILMSDGSTVGGLIVEGYTFFEQLWFPDSEGFLGFRKPFYQSNGIFGGIEGVRNGLAHYAKMKFPPASISFQTFGVPGLKALDIISLDDNLFYITEISHEIDPAENRWWMNITGEWLKPFFGDLGFLKERGETESGSGNLIE